MDFGTKEDCAFLWVCHTGCLSYDPYRHTQIVPHVAATMTKMYHCYDSRCSL